MKPSLTTTSNVHLQKSIPKSAPSRRPIYRQPTGKNSFNVCLSAYRSHPLLTIAALAVWISLEKVTANYKANKDGEMKSRGDE